jgi:hypothetical protein
MLYRVVLQGPPVGDENAAQVQREFMRVTALPEHVTAQLFAQMPQVLKRGLPEADAERIAQTLRAIGAVAAVEREATFRAGGIDPLTITPVTPPPDTVESSPASATPSALRRARPFVLWVAGVAVPVAVATVSAPAFDDWLSTLRPTAGPAAPAVGPKRARTPAPLETPVFNPTFAHGPWRCTDQRTGTTTYWLYAEGGLLAYLGNEIEHGDRPISGPDFPDTWSITPEQLTWRFATKPPQNFKLLDLSFVHLNYAVNAGHETHCIRP